MILQFAFVLTAIIVGARLGGIGLGVMGGIGVIHKNMSIEEQARQVAIVKRAENGMIYE